MDPPTEDTRFLIHHYSTVDIMCLFTTQPRTSSYTPNRGHGLNSIFTPFSSSCTPPPRTEDRPRFGMCPRPIVKFHVCVLVWRCLQNHTHTHTPPRTPHTHTHTPACKTCELGISVHAYPNGDIWMWLHTGVLGIHEIRMWLHSYHLGISQYTFNRGYAFKCIYMAFSISCG